MPLLNKHFLKLQSNYLFIEIEKRCHLLKQKKNQAELISLGVGDITKPIAPSVASAMKKAIDEMANETSIRGYGPSEGYLFLREAIKDNDYKNLPIDIDEIFISDGTKNDIANIQELFSPSTKIAICDPVYPVYVDSNIMAGRSKNFFFLPCTEENCFIPPLPTAPCHVIYLCFPNNPTGTSLSKQELAKWVNYAKKNKALILFDAAYEAFITSPNTPHSIYEIKGADEVAIEFRSFSKTAGFTGLRCSFTVVPKKLLINKHSLNSFWKRRVQTKFGGTAYPVQIGALATYSPQGKSEIQQTLSIYKDNTNFLRCELQKLGLTTYGGIDAPYIWCKTLKNLSSWDFFDLLLEKAHVICTPGKGFGPSGEGFVRFSAFTPKEQIQEAVERIKGIL